MKGDVQKAIVKRLLYGKEQRYNELWDKELCPSNLFDYHLKQLIDEGLIQKRDDRYGLTPEGMRFVAGLDGVAIEHKERPIVCCFILGKDADGRLLLHRRKKQPFRDYVGIPGGKLELGERVAEQAAREFAEETGLRAERLTLKLITNFLTYDGGTLVHQVIGFFFLGEGLSGELIPLYREGENFFATLSEARTLKRYPDFELFVKELLSDRDTPVFKEAKRTVKDGEFLGIEIYE